MRPEFQNSFADRLGDRFYRQVVPVAVPSPYYICWNSTLADQLQLEPTDENLQWLAGNRTPDTSKTIATRYGGHQFGHWAGQLGDGRAMLMGSLNGLEIQLKGAGPTPFSRGADGRAVLRSSIREYICSEAMFHLGVPTTRALCVVGTGESVVRDMFYDGHPMAEPGAICARVSPSFVRFGHFEILAADGDIESFHKLLKYEMELLKCTSVEKFFDEVCRRTAYLMSEWMRVGFVHGVMNTDNMSILGETIDFGPYGWLDVFDLNWTPNTTDREMHRYSFGNQPSVAYWNLQKFAESFLVIDVNLESQLQKFEEYFQSYWEEAMAKKFGLPSFNKLLVLNALELFSKQELDMTIFFRELAELSKAGQLDKCFYKPLTLDLSEQWSAWLESWRQAIHNEPKESIFQKMNEVNPAFLPRNYLLHEAIEQIEKGSNEKLKVIESAIRNPYSAEIKYEKFKRPDWAKNKPGCSMLSCSS